MRRSGPGEQTFGEWLAARMVECRFATNDALAQVIGIKDTTIGRWRRDEVQAQPDQLRKLVDPLRTPLLELLVRAGHLTQAEARLRDLPEPVAGAAMTVEETVQADEQLSERAKVHLINQVKLLRELPPQSGSGAHTRRTPRKPSPVSELPYAASKRDPKAPRKGEQTEEDS